MTSNPPPSTTTSTISSAATTAPTLGPQFENKVYYAKEAYFETRSGNLISKRCLIKGSDHIQISGKTILQQKLIIRGDLAQISLGKYVTLLQSVILKPSYKKHNGKIKFIPMEIGDYVFIEKNTIVSASKIGSYTRIGKDCIIGHRSIIAENVVIADGTIVPPDTIIPAYSLYSGKPSLYQTELPECCNIIQKEHCISYYNNFEKKQGAPPTSSTTPSTSSTAPKPAQPTTASSKQSKPQSKLEN